MPVCLCIHISVYRIDFYVQRAHGVHDRDYYIVEIVCMRAAMVLHSARSTLHKYAFTYIYLQKIEHNTRPAHTKVHIAQYPCIEMYFITRTTQSSSSWSPLPLLSSSSRTFTHILCTRMLLCMWDRLQPC